MITTSTRKLAINKAQLIGLETPRPNGRGVNLFQLAESFGVDRIEEEDVPNEALLIERLDGKYTMFLKRDTARLRQRFSMAHEIAHLLLKPLIGDSIQKWARLDPSQDPKGKQVERLCDEIAGILLMPDRIFCEWLSGEHWTAASLPKASTAFSVSMEVASRRFVDVNPNPTVLARWQLSGPHTIRMSKVPICHKSLRVSAVEFTNSGTAPMKPLIDLFHQEGSLVSSETVRFLNKSSVRTAECKVESFGHGSGQWREVYSFIYPSIQAQTRKDGRGGQGERSSAS